MQGTSSANEALKTDKPAKNNVPPRLNTGNNFAGIKENTITQPTENKEDEKTFNALRSIQMAKAALIKNLEQLRTDLEKASTPEEAEVIKSQIAELSSELKKTEKYLESTATGINLPSYNENIEEIKFSLSDEVQELIKPIIKELKQMTARPREIEQLRAEWALYQEQLEDAQMAVKNVNHLKEQNTDKDLQPVLSEISEKWQAREDQISTQVEVAKLKLDQILASNKSWIKTLTSFLSMFFVQRTLNAFIAMLVFIVSFIVLLLARKIFQRLPPIKYWKQNSISRRVFDLFYYASAIIFSLMLGLLILYASGDWVLLGLVLIILAGLVIGGKNTIPHFFEQTKYLLNLGAVREGERIIYKELPWLVKKINIYTELVNPELTGGRLRVPMREIIPLHSRRVETKEPWFPTIEGDWVELDDIIFGKVVSQTPTWVQVIRLGGSRKVYSTQEFIKKNLLIITRGFRVYHSFDLDYQHIKIATEKIPEILTQSLQQKLIDQVTTEDLVYVSANLKDSGSSALNFEIIADFAGSQAQNYRFLKRFIACQCVDIANENNWQIPFPQLTISNRSDSVDTSIDKTEDETNNFTQ